MLKGVGIDCLEISRIKNIKNKNNFLKSVFTKRELEYCHKFKDADRHLAGKFAAKEAVIKASNGLFKITPREIEILNNSDGSPFVKLSVKTNRKLKIFVSISHSDSVAASVAVIL